MKKRLLALATALVMIIGLLPATVLTATAVTPTYQSFSSADLNNDVTVSADGYTATINDTDSTTGTNQVYLYNVFSGMTNPHMTQTIQINSMPVFTGVGNSANVHQASGYFNVMEGPRTTIGGAYNEPYVRYSIYRADADGNLKLTIFKNNYANGGAAVTAENSYTVDLNKKLTDEFTLTTLWNDHDTVSFYCGGSLLGTYEDVTFNRGNYGGLDALFFGYLPYLADTDNYAATAEIIVKNMIIADGHTPAEDDGDCTTAVKCACGEVAAAAKPAHTFNRKVSTSAYAKEGAAGVFYTSCSVCGTSSKGTAGEATFTAVDISGATKSNYYTLDGNYAVTLYRDNYTHATNGTTDLDDFTLNNLTKDLTEVHLSQTITIDNMTKFSRTVISGNYYQHSGFYNVFFRNRRYIDPEDTTSLRIADWLMYTIQRRDDDGSLYLILAYSPETSMSAAGVPTFTYNDAVALGKKLGETFRLTTVWNEDNSADFYIDGELLVSYDAAQALTVQKSSGASVEYFRFGYYDTYTVETGYESTAKMTVSALTVNDGCIAEDDGDCTTAVVCPECGETVTAAKTHERAEDDNDCTTALLCKNSGCKYEFVPAAANHTPEADDDDCTTDIMCSVCDKVAVEGAANHTPEADDDDCTTDIMCSVCDKVAVEGAANHTPEADDGDCTTDIMCSVCDKVAVEGAANHTPEADDDDCTTDIMCSVCDKVAIEGAANHTPETDDGDCTTDIMCSVCDKVAVEGAEKHAGGTATCKEKAKCATCGKEYGDFAAHKPGDEGDCVTGFTCTVCDKVVPASGTHTPAADDGDCTTAIKCTVCGTVTTAAKDDHTPAADDGDCTTAIKCTVCGTVTTAAKEAHTPAADDGDCTTAIKCTVCGKVTTAAKEAHTEKVVNAKPATETEKGYTGDKVCSVCGKELAKGEEIPATGAPTTEPSTPADPSTPPTTTPSTPTTTPSTPTVNPDTGDSSVNAVYVMLMTVSLLAVAALMIPEIRNKLIRK